MQYIFDVSPLARVTKVKINKRDYIETKISCRMKETINIMKGQPTEKETIFVKSISDKRLVSRTQETHAIQLQKKKKKNKKTTWLKSRQRTWIDIFQKNIQMTNLFSSVQVSPSVMTNSLWHHGLQQARSPCPSRTPRVYSNLCPLSWQCHPTISSSVIPFSSHLQSFPASGSFPVSQFFAAIGRSIEVSASISVLPMTIKDWSPLGWTGWISLQSKGLTRVFSNITGQKHPFFCA